MDFINKAYAQFSELFKTMTVGARITAGLLLAVVIVSLVFLFRMQTTAGEEYLFGNREFGQNELAAMDRAFAESGLGEGQIVGNRMRVPYSQKSLYLQALNEANFQLEQHGSFDRNALNGDFLMTKQLREQKTSVAKEQELSLIVKRMRDIENATVQIDQLRKGGLHSLMERTALVAVKTIGGRSLAPERVKAIRETIAGAVAGLEAKSVTVTDMETGLAYRGTGPDGMSLAGESAYASHKTLYEQFWRDKIVRRLAAIPGVNVEVNVELNPQLRNEEVSRKVDAKAVSVSIKERSKGLTTKGASSAGRPGAVPNGVVSNTAASVEDTARSESELTESDSEQRLLPSTDHVVTTTAPLTPNRVTASIDVPQSYFEKIWRRDNPIVEGEEPKEPEPIDLKKIEETVKKKIEESVVGLLPSVPAGVDPYPQVVVTTYPDMKIEMPPEEALSATAMSWFAENWRTLGLMGFGLFGLVMLRSMVRPRPSDSPTPEAGSVRLSDADDDEEEGETAGKTEAEISELKKRRFQTSGPNLRNDLTDLVAEDPDTAAAVLSKWIGDAA